MQDSSLETVVLELLAGVLPSRVCGNALDERSTGSYNSLVETFEVDDRAVFVFEKLYFLPHCHCARTLARVAVAVQCLGDNGPHEIIKNELEGSAGNVCGPITISLLSILPDGTRVTCRPVSITVQAVPVHLAQNIQTPRIDVSHAAMRRCQRVKGLGPQGSVFVFVVQP